MCLRCAWQNAAGIGRFDVATEDFTQINATFVGTDRPDAGYAGAAVLDDILYLGPSVRAP